MSSAASWLDALAMHLADNGLGTCGTSIWIGRRSDDPALPDLATILTEVPGAVSENFGAGGDTAMPMFALYVRGTGDDYAAARKRISDAYWLLSQIAGQTIHGFRFLRVGAPGATPAYLGRDENDRPAFSVEMWTWQPATVPTGITYAP